MIEQRMYKGDLIQRLIRVAEHLSARNYILTNSLGHTYGIACLMTESDASERNRNLTKVTDYQWTLVPERKL